MEDLSSDAPASSLLLREGETCWRRVSADRVAFLIDGESYFSAVVQALENARESVWMLGWDFHSSVRLRRRSDDEHPARLVELLEARVRERPSLQVHVLGWDFALLYAMEREFLPLLQFGTRTHPRIRFALDSTHPLTASHHQKLVLIDDRMAFAGGFDLTTHRWDTREHAADDPRRVTPAGARYQPFHDVQVAVDGEAAAALGELARERWLRATGDAVDPGRAGEHDPWPPDLDPGARHATVAIARTLPAYREYPEVREVEALYRESIAAARRWIYIENQYLTSAALGDWLAARLREPDGPEILIVGPQRNAGWLEETTMGALRDRVVRQLRDADEHARLRVLYPHVPGLGPDEIVNVHSKVMVIDDELARVGSSNLSNRSLGLDSECDLLIAAGGREPLRRAVAGLRDDLLAEHLGVSPERVAEALAAHGSLVAAVDDLCGGERTLRPLELDAPDELAGAIDTLGAVDPEHPAPLEELLLRFDAERPAAGSTSGHALWSLVAAGALLGGLALIWRATPLSAWIEPERLGALLELLRVQWYGPPAAAAIFAVASLLLVPVTALTIAAGLALGPLIGVPVAWAGSLAGAAAGYGVGHLLWRDAVRRVAGERLNTLSERLARRGIVATALLRLVPVAPFTVVNLVAGASQVRAGDFLIGTALGMLPGTLLLILAADGIAGLFRDPDGPAWLWAALALVPLLALVVVRRVLARSEGSGGSSGAP